MNQARCSAPLDVLFSYPYVWQPAKTISFLRATHNVLEGKCQICDDDEEQEREISEFRNVLEESSKIALGDKGNWKSALGRKHFEMLAGRRKRLFKIRIKMLCRRNEISSSSLVDLVGIMRNKYDHSEVFTPDERNELGWWQNPFEQLDDALFVSYWTRRFPNLVPYLWMKFYRYRSNPNLKNYYPYPLDDKEGFFDLAGFSEELSNSLQEKLDGGGGARRNSEPEISENLGTSIKVKILPANLLKRTLSGGSCSLGIKLLPDKLTFLWQQNGKKKVDMISYDFPDKSRMTTREPTALIVLNGGSELGKMILEPSGLEAISRVIIFGDKARLKDKMSKMGSASISRQNSAEVEKPVEEVPVENPIKYLTLDWNGMSDRCRDAFQIESKFILQGKLITLKDILPDNDSTRNKLLSELKGNLLYDLLKKEKPVLLENHNLPLVTNGYLERQIYYRPVRQVKMNEDELLENLERSRNSEQIIFIADKSGSGKTQVLRSIGWKLLEKFRNRIILIFNMKDFIEHLKLNGNNKVAKSNVIAAITDLCCVSEFEQKLMGYWLEQKYGKLSFEIMFDGIDEVPVNSLEMAIDVLRIICAKLPAVRIWATTRSHVLNDKRINFECSVYKLEQLSEEEQIDLVEMTWIEYWDKYRSQEIIPRSEILRNFARKCLSNFITESNFVGTPLQCRMIADIYKMKLLNRDFTIDNYSNSVSGNDLDNNGNDTNFGTLVGQLFRKLTSQSNLETRPVDLDNIWIGSKYVGPLMNIYESLINKKFEEFVRERKAIPDSIKMDHSIVQALRDKMDRFHIYFALKSLFPPEVAEEFRGRLLKTAESKKQVNSDVLEFGIIESISPVVFKHRTMAEYFVALFIYKISNDQFWYAAKVDSAFKRFHQHWLRTATEYSRQWPQINSRQQKPQFPLFCQFLRTMCGNKREFKLLLLQLHHYY